MAHSSPSIIYQYLQDWVMRLPLHMQGILVTALRGPDGIQGHDINKSVVRPLRAVVTRSPHKVFIGDGRCYPLLDDIKELLDKIDAYPIHWVLHTVQAAEVIAYTHPEPEIREKWLIFYTKFCKEVRLNPESIEDFLKWTVDEGELFYPPK